MRIVCILGRSGGGKSSVEAELEKLGYNRIISYTTRGIRGNEKDGKEYHFVTREQFQTLIDKGILMEYAEYNGNFYGAPKPVGSINNVIVVETDGLEKIKEIYGSQAIGVYIDTPLEVIKRRLKNRNDTSIIEAEKRSEVDNQKFESIKSKVDIVVNGDQTLDMIVLDILRYIRSRR